MLYPDCPCRVENIEQRLDVVNVAVGIDSRNTADELQGFRAVMESIQKRGIKTEIVFLEANDAVLLKRF